MRIIAGDFKGRKLESPINNNIRPTSDKVKEAIFNIIAGNVPEAICVDLFAGTGNLGLEAISRGAEKCYFCDSSNESIGLIRENIEICKASDVSRILVGDYSRTLSRITDKIDIFFLDPPYKAGLYEDCFSQIRELDLLAEEGIIIAEHGAKDIMPDEICGFEKIKEKKYGTIVISIYG
ncbi:MAG: 16S rRNA (guanine(966)-N(2))-methyltransferase RsmD [Eubacteriales bacterium]|nr:16S rRNA (guanine(966)-N(2))-methyltransferase RsmD [Eubacteriales bacterium]